MTEPTPTPPQSEPGTPRPIQLAQFMKLEGLVETGGQAKFVIQGGEVSVNGEIETRRGRKLAPGDKVEFRGQTAVVP